MLTAHEDYNFAAKYYALHLIPSRRRTLELGKEEVAGERFNDDERVLWEIESMVSATGFGRDPEKYIDMALHSCANRDYHYNVTNEYEGEDCEIEEE